MGISVSSQAKRAGGIFLNLPSAAQVIHWDGRLQELWHPTTAGELLSHNPHFFLCCSETMNVDCLPRQMAKDEPLLLGQLYFLIPVSKINRPFSLQDLCTLAVKASNALKCDSGMGGVAWQTSLMLPAGKSSQSVVRFYTTGTVICANLQSK